MQTEPTIDEMLDALLAEPADAGRECACETPLRVERAERRGAARTYCSRCDLPVPIRWTPR
jgi:hypothetical protein